MWLTGFDAPCFHTMYIDKPIKGHNLMQEIASFLPAMQCRNWNLRAKSLSDRVLNSNLRAKSLSDRVLNSNLRAKSLSDRVLNSNLRAKSLSDRVLNWNLRAKSLSDRVWGVRIVRRSYRR
jgi:hypothetical protein